ncbi:hypothetical protein HK101_000929, partial [Irineochytrium annulatum]
VAYLHNRGIVHRDLKLENLLLDANRNVIITDFGFANVTREESLLRTSCGSPTYAAPELVTSDGYFGEAADIWSCGVILYAMLCGHFPFDDDPSNPDSENIGLLYKHIMEAQLDFPDYVSEDAKMLLQRMLVPDPKYRAKMDEVLSHRWLAPSAKIFEVERRQRTKGGVEPTPPTSPILETDEMDQAHDNDNDHIVDIIEPVPISAKPVVSAITLGVKAERMEDSGVALEDGDSFNDNVPTTAAAAEMDWRASSSHPTSTRNHHTSIKTQNSSAALQVPAHSLHLSHSRSADDLRPMPSKKPSTINGGAGGSASGVVMPGNASADGIVSAGGREDASLNGAGSGKGVTIGPGDSVSHRISNSSSLESFEEDTAGSGGTNADGDLGSKQTDEDEDDEDAMGDDERDGEETDKLANLTTITTPSSGGTFMSWFTKKGPVAPLPSSTSVSDGSAEPPSPNSPPAPSSLPTSSTLGRMSTTSRGTSHVRSYTHTPVHHIDVDVESWYYLPPPRRPSARNTNLVRRPRSVYDTGAAANAQQMENSSTLPIIQTPPAATTPASPAAPAQPAKPRLATHVGPIDKRAISTREPAELVREITKALEARGMQVRVLGAPGDCRVKVVRPESFFGVPVTDAAAAAAVDAAVAASLDSGDEDGTTASGPSVSFDGVSTAPGSNSSGSLGREMSPGLNRSLSFRERKRVAKGPAKMAMVVASLPVSIVKRFKYFTRHGPHYDHGFDGRTKLNQEVSADGGVVSVGSSASSFGGRTGRSDDSKPLPSPPASAVAVPTGSASASGASAGSPPSTPRRSAGKDGSKEASGGVEARYQPELRFNIEVQKIRNLSGIYVVDFKRIRGDIWAFKRLYHELIKDMPLRNPGEEEVPI